MDQTPKNTKKSRKMIFKLNLNLRNVFLVLFIGFLIFSFILSLAQTSKLSEEKSLSQIITDIKDNKVKKITVEDTKLKVIYLDGSESSSRKETQDSIYKILDTAKVDASKIEINVKDASVGQIWISLISNLLPLLLMVGFFLFIIRQARGAQDNIFSFGQSKAKLFNKDNPQITFANVAGVNEAKKETSG